MSLRGILRGFGLKVGPTAAGFDGRVRELVAGHPALLAIAEALLLARATLAVSLGLLKSGWSLWPETTRGRGSDVDARGWRARRPHLCFRNRRPGPVPILKRQGRFWGWRRKSTNRGRPT